MPRNIQPIDTQMGREQSLRILMLDPAGSSVQVTHNLCNHLSALGCDVHVFTAPHWERSIGDCTKSAYQRRIIFYLGTQSRSYEAQAFATRIFWRILRLAQHLWADLRICLIARRFDLIHTQTLSVPFLDYLCLRVIARHTPIVCTVHELVPHMSRFRRFTGGLLGAIYGLADCLFVFTNYTRNRLISERGVSPEKILVVPHGNLEHTVERAKAPEPAYAGRAPIILFIGGIRPDKGVDVLIEAASHLRKKVPEFKVLIAGTPGFDMSTVQSSVKELGLQKIVEFDLRYLPEQDFADYMSQATVVALPYRRVEQSGVAIAACTFGKAIVATRCGGVAELVTDAENGLLVPIDDAIALAEALAIVLLDGGKRQLFEFHSKKYAREALAWEPIALKTLATYKAAILQRANRRMQAVTDFRGGSLFTSARATDAEASVKITKNRGPIGKS